MVFHHSFWPPRRKTEGEKYPSCLQLAMPPNEAIIDYINSAFPDEASLVAVEPLIHKLRHMIHRVDAGLLIAVRKQSSSGTKAKEDLEVASGAIEELAHKIMEIKSKAQQSEVMVQELCRDIKKLDFAKKHLTATITSLHRLFMLVSAMSQLEEMVSKMRYREAARQLEAVNQLCSYFEAYQESPRISELRERLKVTKQTLRTQIFSDFSNLGTSTAKDDPTLMQKLQDACLVVDVLDRSVRDEFINSTCSKELLAYQHIFQGTEVAKLDKVERRYAWIKRQLRGNEDMWQYFPSSWRVEYLLCMQFCKVTRAQIMESLDGFKERLDVQILLQALQATLEFEQYLAEKFKSTNPVDRHDLDEAEQAKTDESSASTIRRKYEKQLTRKGRSPSRTSQVSIEIGFEGIISACFEPYLNVYIELEEKTLGEAIEKLIQEETWEAQEGSQTSILSSSSQVFLMIKRSLKRCSALTKKKTLLDLFKVFQRILRAYAAKLIARLPKFGSGIVATATGADKMTDKDERVICYIVNTSEYCHETAGQLAENVSTLVEPQFSEGIDMSHEQDEFSGVITQALSTLVIGLQIRLEHELVPMARMPWASLEGVGDQSEYVNGISVVLSGSAPAIGSLLSQLHFQFFLDKLAASFLPRFYLSIFKCKRISDPGAQQMLLDTQAIKTLFLEVPSLGGQAPSTSYAKYVTREIGKAETLLKIMLSSIESVGETYCALFPEGTITDFQRILDLKGLKRAEQQQLLDYVSKRGVKGQPANTYQAQSSKMMVTSTSSPSAVNKEAIMAKAAALGREAMAQSSSMVSSAGFKRIFGAKDGSTKDSGFRKLFN